MNTTTTKPTRARPTRRSRPPIAWNAEGRAIRRLSRIVRETLQAHPAETSGEIAALVKDRLRFLRLPWTPAQLHTTLSLLDRRPVIRPPRPPPITEMAQQADPPWRQPRSGSSTWTSLRDLATVLRTKARWGR